MSCGVVHRLGLDPMLLWLWRRPAAVALIWPPAWELPYAMGAALKKTKKKKKKKMMNRLKSIFKTYVCMPPITNYPVFFICKTVKLKTCINWNIKHKIVLDLKFFLFVYFIVISPNTLFFFFSLYSVGTQLHIHVYIIFSPIVVLHCRYLDIVLSTTQQDLIVNPFQKQ